MKNLRTLSKFALHAPLTAVLMLSLVFTVINYPIISAPMIRPVENKTPDIATMVSSSVLNSLEKLSIRKGLSKDNTFELLGATARIAVVTSRSSGTGTGVLIYQKKLKDTAKSGYQNYIITNSHVVKTAPTVRIEFFHYIDNKYITESLILEGTVIENDDTLDLALISVISSRPLGKPVEIITQLELDDVSLRDPVYVCGCSLGNPPAITEGQLLHARYGNFTVSAFSIFGNSGGGTFTSDGKLLGIVSRIGGVKAPDGVMHPEPNITWVISSTIIRNWLNSEGYAFILK